MSIGPGPQPWSAEDFRPIAAILEGRHALLLTPHRLTLLQARLQARLRAQGVPSFTWFHERELLARPNGPGHQLLIDLSTVNHTSFFREAVELRFVAEQLASQMRSTPAVPVRIWSAGCSAGQEPYSLAISLAELVPGLGPERLEYWASDLSYEIVHAAARAIYRDRELTDVTPERLRRFFLRGRGPRSGEYRVAPEIRRLVRFVHFDLRSSEWPIPGVFDAILCRNVLLYFTDEERPQVLDRLARHLRPGGWLIIGNCEILPDRPGLLEKYAPSIFRRVTTP